MRPIGAAIFGELPWDPAGLPDNYGLDISVAIRDGVLVVCKDATVPDGFILKA